MKLFVSWFGKYSKSCAQALGSWLPKVIQSLTPIISVVDIEERVQVLKDTNSNKNIDLLCFTREDIYEPWIYYGIGAITKAVNNDQFYIIFCGREPFMPPDILSQFRTSELHKKEDMQKVIQGINETLDDKSLSLPHLDEAFSLWWPILDESILKIAFDQKSHDPARVDRVLYISFSSAIRKALLTLTPIEEHVVRMKLNIGPNVDSHVKLSKEQVKEYEAKAFRKLRRTDLFSLILREIK